MKRKVFIVSGIIFVFFCFVSTLVAETRAPLDARKHTEAGKYVTSREAYEMWRANPEKIKIIDCRTQEEYVFVGHAPMAYNIPSKLWTGKWNEEKRSILFRTIQTSNLKLKRSLVKMIPLW